MKHLMDKLITKRYRLVVEECDVTKTLAVINKYCKFRSDMKVGNCGWADTTKWFIFFTGSKAEWKLISGELDIRLSECCDIPKNTVGIVYLTY